MQKCFHSFLVGLAIITEHNLTAVFGGSLELTLLYGLLPNNSVEVLGVCWTLGVIFLFYLLFPAYSVLMKTPKRAWISLGISLWIVLTCECHFFSSYFVTESFVDRHSFLYCIPFFVSGGILYLYREAVQSFCDRYPASSLALCLATATAWYAIPNTEIPLVFYMKTLVLFSLWLGYGLGSRKNILSSRIMKYFSGISMEMYLAHMVIFRGIEKLNLLYIFPNDAVNYILVFVLVIIGLAVFIEGFRRVWSFICFGVQKHQRGKGSICNEKD